MRFAILLLLLAAFDLVPGPLAAQVPETQAPLRVYLDCGPCDFDYVRTEIGYVDWMRDRADADLHILARTETTGAGGRQFTLDFIGLRRHAGKSDTLSYVSRPNDAQDVTRRGLARLIQMGLMRYVADTPAAAQIVIGVARPAGGGALPPPAPTRDPWNAWVFSIGGNGFWNGESTQENGNASLNLSANRVTPGWKTNYSVRGTYARQKFTYAIPRTTRDTTVVSINRNYNANALIVRSVNGHTSVGTRLSAGTSTFGNTEFFVTAQPAIEYNLFPYAESTRRQLVVNYGAGVMTQQYREETIYSRLEETRPIHSLSTSYSTRQTWGNLNLGIGGQQFLHDPSLYNLNFSGGTSLNILRGLSFNVNGSYTMVRDQIALPKRNLTPEEVLLRQRQVATNYRFFMNAGFSYRFGSPVQNVVNPRFGSTGGGGMMMMQF
jgi:hypothetical protein